MTHYKKYLTLFRPFLAVTCTKKSVPLIALITKLLLLLRSDRLKTAELGAIDVDSS
ncbi:MAG: hypothetical protein V7K88_02675 [Nostoc sp.]|uniref:hypothetical protein n=1 Tax=Nostoc sp. TaxID=1180 RepID=UPI002FFC7605